MDTRTQTLDAIQQYITTQRALLSRTQADIDRLLRLKREAIDKPNEFMNDNETDTPSFDLTDISECAPALPGYIDWSLYASLDPTRLRTLTQNTTLSHSKTYPKTPHKTQRSPLSPLQRFVKDARVNILEPVLGLGLSPNPGSGVSTPGGAATSEVAEVDIDGEGGTAHGNKDLRGGKKKKGGLTVVLPPLSQVQLRNRNANRVFLPTPTTASSSATSTSTPTFNLSRPRTRRLTTAERHSRASTIDFQTPATPTLSFPSSTHTPTPPPYPLPHKTSEAHQNTAQSTRTRRPSSKFSKGDFVDCTAPKRRIRSSTIIKDSEGVKMEPCTPASSSTVVVAAQSIKLGKRARRASSPPIFQPPHPPHNSRSNNSTTKTKTKPKPETYRQAWSVSEQHLLEQLLDEIPDGEKNRWAKISQAMQGKRTPRQVASRVQKYFEKLKRFGVGVEVEDLGGDDELT